MGDAAGNEAETAGLTGRERSSRFRGAPLADFGDDFGDDFGENHREPGTAP